MFFRTVYVYDIEACHQNILRSLNIEIDLKGLEKLEKNIKIGKLQNIYPNLKDILRKITNSIIDVFKKENNVSEKEIIIQQYDGLISTRILKPMKVGNIKIFLREVYDYLIMSHYNKTSYIAVNFSKNKYIFKGISNKYEEIEKYLTRLLNINFSDKSIIFEELKNIKENLINSQDIHDFIIIKDNENFLILKKYGVVKISSTIKKMIDLKDIDKERYFDYYLLPFTKTISKTFLFEE